MKKTLTIFILSLCVYSYGQNLVPNPSFEDYNSCPTGAGQITVAIGWHSYGNTPDFFNSCIGSNCANAPHICVPTNWVGSQMPNTGNGYAGVFSGAGYFVHEFIGTQLATPLVAGHSYEVSYYISLGDNYTRAIDRMGANFSNTQLAASNLYNQTPQIITPTGFYLQNKSGWTLIRDTFVASGGEKFMTIGNFNAETNTNYISGLGGAANYAYYYIDDVKVIRINCEPPVVDIGNDTFLCQNESLILEATTPNSTYKWQDNSMDSTYTITEEGTYWVEVTDDCGSTLDTIDVYFSDELTIDLGGDITLCQGDSLILDAATPNVSYRWQDGSTDSTFIVKQQGSYWVQISDGCDSIIDAINVASKNLPVADLGNDLFFCPGDTLMLDATTPDVSYLWQDGSTDSIFTVTEPGDYWIQLTNSCGSDRDTVSAKYTNPPKIDLGNDTTYCVGETILLPLLTAEMNFVRYLWQDSSSFPAYIVSQPGQYWVRVTGICDSVSDTVNIAFIDPPNIDLGNDTAICHGEILTLDVTSSNVSYLWHDNSTEPTFTVTQEGSYWVQASSCRTESDTIMIDYINCNCYLDIANAFSPNSDNLNDGFSPITNCDFSIYHFTIYTRWGEKIFESNNYEDTWDGTYKGEDCQMGAYIYYLEYTYNDTNVKETKKGTVTLIR